MKSYLPMFFGKNKEDRFSLSIKIEEEKRKKEEAEEFKILEAKFKRKCLKSIFNKDGHEIDTPEYKFCIISKAIDDKYLILEIVVFGYQYFIIYL